MSGTGGSAAPAGFGRMLRKEDQLIERTMFS